MRELSTFSTLLARIGTTLEDRGVPYMVIGGYAAILYGEPRLTRDIDITVGLGPDHLDRLLDAVRQADLVPAQGAEDLARRNYVLPCSDPTTQLDVDIILAVSTYEQEAMARSRTVAVGGANVRFASPEDVLIHKVVAGRPRDMGRPNCPACRCSPSERGQVLECLESH
jgi:predicted nucleotidyltransferase